VIEVHADTLLFAADHQSTRTLIPAASLTGVEVSQGMHSHVLAGAGLGFLGGAVAGGVIGYGLAHEQNSLDGDWGPVGAAVGAGIVGAVGAGVGALVGSRRTERWGALRLPINVGLLPSTDALGLSLAVTLMPRTSWKP
jgi:drug/metabolite transporter (DMT)-like permease